MGLTEVLLIRRWDTRKQVKFRMLTYDLKRAFSLKWFVISMSLMPALMLLTNLDSIVSMLRENTPPQAGWTLQMVTDAMAGDGIMFALPMLCTLPFSSAFLDEYKAGILKFALPRMDRRKFLLSKILCAASSGGAVLASGGAAMILLAYIVFSPLEGAREVAEQGAGADTIKPALDMLVRYLCFGAFGGVAGMYISSALNNRYMAWLGPFMLQYLLVILCERYMPGLELLYPPEWIDPSSAWPWAGWSSCVWLLVLTGFFAWRFIRTASRRLDYV